MFTVPYRRNREFFFTSHLSSFTGTCCLRSAPPLSAGQLTIYFQTNFSFRQKLPSWCAGQTMHISLGESHWLPSLKRPDNTMPDMLSCFIGPSCLSRCTFSHCFSVSFGMDIVEPVMLTWRTLPKQYTLLLLPDKLYKKATQWWNPMYGLISESINWQKDCCFFTRWLN